MAKSPEAFRTISEVADWLGVQAHVLRFWESKFTQVKPVKRAGGRRYYRPADMLLLGGIKKLLHDDGMTIKGVQKTLREQGASYVADHSPSLDDLTMAQLDDEVAVVSQQDQSTVLPFEGAAVSESLAEEETPGASAEQNTPVAESPTEPTPNDAPAAEEVPEAPQAEAEVAQPEVLNAEPEATEPEEPVEETSEPAAEPEFASEPEPGPEPELEFISQAAPEPEPEPTPEAEPETKDAVPAFMHRVIEETPAPPAKVPLIIDAPDAPPEDQIEVPPGLLARLSALESIPVSQIDKMRAAKAQLETLHARLSGTGKE